ncbi:MAG: toll/interleukin-1 receptor domain-containing protein [Bacteroidota bacterium]
MSDIFISYSSADRDKAKIFANALEQHGWSVWWDRKIPPGKKYDEVIEEELDKAKCVVVLWSEESVKSDWVKEEITEAAQNDILVPVLIHSVRIPLGFRRIQAAMLFDWNGEPKNSEFLQFVNSIQKITGTGKSKSLNPVLKETENISSRLKSPQQKEHGIRETARSLSQNHDIDSNSNLVRLSLPKRIYSDMFLAPTGDYLYITRLRETVNYRNYYDLIYYNTLHRNSKLLADIGTDDIFGGFTNDLFFKSVSVEEHNTSRILAFNKETEVAHPVSKHIVESFTTVHDKIIYKKNNQYICFGHDGNPKQLDLRNEYYDLSFCDHPYRQIAIGKKIREGNDVLDRLYDHFFIEFDNDFNILNETKLFSDTREIKYGRFSGWTSTQILYHVKLNKKGRLAEHQFTFNALNINSIKSSPVFTHKYEMGAVFSAHRDGFIFYAEEIEQNQLIKLFIYDNERQENYCIKELKGSYRNFCLNSDWSKIFFKQVYDTNGKGTFYDWENESEIYSMVLKM